MSKIRQNLPSYSDELSLEPTGDLAAYVIFTQLKKDGEHRLAGYLDASDDEMAIVLAKEHYGQDQPCVNIWAIPRRVVAGTGEEFPTSREGTTLRTWQVFTQESAGDAARSEGTVDATCSAIAVERALETTEGATACHRLWVVPLDAIAATEPDELIWRYTDQTYRLARGYSKAVREKWEAIRADREITEYEKDDLKETF
ncbi:MAG: hypothetical protein KC983_08830 [Phycisphaerales bacterium]|nr:hypothetical protein [Phycisphaerales bacterium]